MIFSIDEHGMIRQSPASASEGDSPGVNVNINKRKVTIRN